MATTKKSASKSATKKAHAKSASKNPTKKSAAKRELISPNNDKRYVRRNSDGQFSESADVGKSLSQDKKVKAKTVAKPGQGDRGDLAKKKSAAVKK